MAEEARQKTAWTLSPGLQRAGLVTVSGVALLAILLYTRLPSVLPGYPAVLVAFFVWAVAPGWLLQRAIFGTRTTGIVERLVVAFLLSLALASVPGVLALRFHWSLQTFAMLYAVVASIVSGLSLLWRPRVREPPAGEEPHEEPGTVFANAPLLLLIGVPLLAIVTSPLWSGDRIARDADDLVYVGYVNEYATTDTLDASKPFHDTRRGSYSRMQVNVWVVVEALVADSAGVEALDLLMDYLPPLLTVLAVAAMFALAKGLFGSTQVALLAGALVLGYGVLDLAPPEGYGRNVLLRMSQDKMLASFVLVPVGLLLGSRFLSRPTAETYLATVLAVVALFVVHPMVVIFLGVALASVAMLGGLVDRSLAKARIGALLLLPWAAFGLGFLLWSWLGGDRGLIMAPRLRRQFHMVDLPGGLVMGDYHQFLHPLMLATLLLALPVWLIARRNIGNQLMLATVVGVVLVFFVPVLATPLANAVAEEAVWRIHRLVLVPLILAYALNYATNRFLGGRHVVRLARRSLVVPTTVVPTAAVLLVLAGAFFVQEQYAVADDGAYYNRTSGTELLPWTGGSIFLGGVERAFSSDWRPTPAERGLLEYLRANAAPGSTVLIPPSISSRFFPGVLQDIRPVDYRGAPDIQERRAMLAAFYDGSLRGAELREALERYGATHVVTGSRTAAEESVQALGAARVEALEPLAVFGLDGFCQRVGTPDLALRVGADDEYPAWALGPDGREELAGPTITIPPGASSESQELDLIVEVAPATDVVGRDGVARLVVTLDELEDGGRVVGEPIHSVVDLFLEEGTEGGARLFRVRSPAATFSAGDTYRIRVWRDGGHAVDTYPDDIWFIGLTVAQPLDRALISADAYEVYRIEDE